ncbi:MAG: HNH endonuclease [Bacteroidetes bacterium]|jgi:putative restriction endonuclease|nr:HNH endonuclease [Bacteroidota bacterium]MBT6687689.1 HNH endonuclease [Bacteroidota bacterium]MBT7143612.1 HNH endonuclease [Bacteroidota bacterium]MBT7490513.1 HNH endonuclease [Bacteroidota bacterium]
MASRHRKYDLLELIIQGIRDDGWNILYLSDPKYHPFRLKIYKGEESHNVRIYIWNLTHGGGAMRPADEYRIQITGVEQFDLEPNGKTLILGWWREGEVFAGFDFNKHNGVLGFSPSIQIREEALRKAHIKGMAAWEKDNQEIAISFRPDFITEYIRNLESLHSFGESEQDLEVLEVLTDNPEEVNDAEIAEVTEERQTTVVSVKKKIRDNSFKSRVLTSYSNHCAFCGIQLKLIDAAHIVPVQHDGTDETSNGISLCAIHHRAFDRNLVTFNSDYQILTSEKNFDKLKEIGLDGGAEKFINDLRAVILLPPTISDRPHVDFVNLANEIRGW